jgi:hypothetical protein
VAHGLTIDLLVGLVRAGLASSQIKRSEFWRQAELVVSVRGRLFVSVNRRHAGRATALALARHYRESRLRAAPRSRQNGVRWENYGRARNLR